MSKAYKQVVVYVQDSDPITVNETNVDVNHHIYITGDTAALKRLAEALAQRRPHPAFSTKLLALAALSLLAGCSQAATPAADLIPSPAVRGSAASGGPHLGSEHGYPTREAKVGAAASVPGVPTSDPSPSLAVDQPEPSGDSQTSEGVGELPALASAAPSGSIAPPPVSLTTAPPLPGPVESRAAGDSWFIEHTGSLPPAYVSACESGDNYRADNGYGHTGRWQFSSSTWQSVGGSGRAMDASPAEQDYRASLLWADGAGAGHWTCAA